MSHFSMLFAQVLLFATLVASTTFVPLEYTNDGVCPAKNGTMGDYEQFLYATFWAATSCITFRNSTEVGPVQGSNLFTIHGLWAGDHPDVYPTCCNLTNKFNATEVRDIRNLTKNWVSYNSPDEQFYAHEWEKHGTCATDVFPTIKDYFSSVLDFHMSLNLANALTQAGITPGDERYPKTSVSQALAAAIGHVPLLECTTYEQKSYLNAVYMCVDRNMKVIECGSDYFTAYQDSCPNSFHIPAIPDDCYRQG